MRRDLDELVRAATARGLFLHLSTNGLALDEARIERLLAAGLNSVFVAWELGAPKDAQAARRRAAVERAVRACARQGLPCFLSVCVRRENVWNGDVEAALAAGRALGAAGVRLFAVRPSGAWLHQGDEALLDAPERARLRSLCRSGYAWLTDDAEKAAGRSCAAFARRIVYVSPYGELQPCHFFPFGFGDVRAGDLDAALDRMWSHPMLLDRYPDCALEHRGFRAEHVAPLAGGARLPLMV
ncbi:MAG: hypothetical protein HY908_02670 [Myxococcales bacterium]|nr:hypothetical protein [Myxococcales bacterium]